MKTIRPRPLSSKISTVTQRSNGCRRTRDHPGCGPFGLQAIRAALRLEGMTSSRVVETNLGWPPVGARHFRQPQRGRHVHTVCPDGEPCSSHVDRWNPVYPEEVVPHLRDDFWPAYKDTILLVGGFALVVLLAR